MANNKTRARFRKTHFPFELTDPERKISASEFNRQLGSAPLWKTAEHEGDKARNDQRYR